MAQTANGAVLATGLQAEDAQGLGNHHLLHLVVWGRDTLEDLQALHGGGTTGSLVGDHAADSLVEDSGGSAEMEGTTTGGVVSGHLAQVGVVLHYEGVSDDLDGRLDLVSEYNDSALGWGGGESERMWWTYASRGRIRRRC